MELVISKNELVQALQVIAPVTDKSSTKPILSNFLLRAGNGESQAAAEFSATDYEIGIVGRYPAQVSQPGEVCISARKMLEVCREFMTEEIRITSDEQLWVTVEGGPSRLRLPSVETGLYPQTEVAELAHRFRMPARELRRCIDMTLFATQTSETRKNLMGVALTMVEGNVLRWTATDGHRLAQVTKETALEGGAEAPEIIVPRKALVEMQKVLDEAEGEVGVSYDDRSLVLTTGRIVLTTRLIEGKFPNVEAVIPRDNDKLVQVNRERLGNALKIVSFMSSDKIKPVKLSLEPGQLRVESERAEYGDVKDELPVEYEGEPFQIGFNARYLLDVLGVVGHVETVELALKGPLNPCLVRLPEDASFMSVVMPLRIEW